MKRSIKVANLSIRASAVALIPHFARASTAHDAQIMTTANSQTMGRSGPETESATATRMAAANAYAEAVMSVLPPDARPIIDRQYEQIRNARRELDELRLSRIAG